MSPPFLCLTFDCLIMLNYIYSISLKVISCGVYYVYGKVLPRKIMFNKKHEAQRWWSSSTKKKKKKKNQNEFDQSPRHLLFWLCSYFHFLWNCGWCLINLIFNPKHETLLSWSFLTQKRCQTKLNQSHQPSMK